MAARQLVARLVLLAGSHMARGSCTDDVRGQVAVAAKAARRHFCRPLPSLLLLLLVLLVVVLLVPQGQR